jgi:DNA-binding transcriptional regulator YhcF (GntR family)
MRRSVHDEIAAQLRDMIVEGALFSGRKVPEAQLCSRFGVSRPRMREALKVLASEGAAAQDRTGDRSLTKGGAGLSSIWPGPAAGRISASSSPTKPASRC